jgi:hypothetical protein
MHVTIYPAYLWDTPLGFLLHSPKDLSGLTADLAHDSVQRKASN